MTSKARKVSEGEDSHKRNGGTHDSSRVDWRQVGQVSKRSAEDEVQGCSVDRPDGENVQKQNASGWHEQALGDANKRALTRL